MSIRGGRWLRCHTTLERDSDEYTHRMDHRGCQIKARRESPKRRTLWVPFPYNVKGGSLSTDCRWSLVRGWVCGLHSADALTFSTGIRVPFSFPIFLQLSPSQPVEELKRVPLSHMRITSWIFETITNIPAPEPGWKTED